MTRYHFPSHRAVFGITAMTLAAMVTIVSIVIPASLPARNLDSVTASRPASIEADIIPSHIEVVARKPNAVSQPRASAQPDHRG